MERGKTKKTLIILIVVVLTICILLALKFTVFNGNKDVNVLDGKAQNIGYAEYKETNSFNIINTFGKDIKFNKAQGIAYSNGKIFVSDSENDRVVILSKSGELLKVVGKSGNGQGEFIKPRGITADKDGNVYIVDSGNNRIEIFDLEGNYKDELSVNEFSTPYKNSEYIRDVEIDNSKNLYVSTYAYYGERQCIYVYNSKKLVKAIRCSASGLLSRCGNDIFFIADMELIKSGKERKLRPGKTYICKVTPEKLENIYKLNDSSSPKSVCLYEKNYYILYKPMPSIDMFRSDFKYKETVFLIKWNSYDDYKGFTDMTVDEDGNFYCIDDDKNLINVLHKKG